LGVEYAQYHEWLNDFDDAEWRKFLPRSMKWTNVLDLWAWDGRMYHWLEKSGYARYVASDISQLLLNIHPWKDVEKVFADLEDVLPWDDWTFDVITSFFVLHYIKDLSWLFHEVYRLLSAEWRWIFTLFPQRREFVHKHKKKKFKIETYPYSFDMIEKLAEEVWFAIHTLDVMDHRQRAFGKAYCLMRK
jgi:ubiquinone/menaquinone biosynthesis C-methylase UbiE